MNRKVYITSAVLILCAALCFYFRISFGGQSIRPEFDRVLWRVEIGMNISGKGARAKVRLTMPKETERQTIYNENFDNDSMSFQIKENSRTKNRIGYWTTEILDGTRSMKYTLSAQLKSQTYDIPPDLELDPFPTESIPEDYRIWLNPSEYIQSDSKTVQKYLKKAIGREKNVSRVMRKMFDFVRGQVNYKSDKKSKDAIETLKALTADCGGQARAMAALSRAAGIPSRVVGGIILEPGVKQITHVWIENYIGGKWIPFDTVNNHFAFMPKHYLQLYWGDVALLRHVGLSKIDYYFNVGYETMPPVDQPWSLYVIPAHFHNLTKITLLIPIGAMLVAISRLIIGIPTFGTFGPVLLAIAFQEVSLVPGLIFVFIVLGINLMIRKFLDHLKILIIPKLAILVTMVVIVLISIMMISVQLGDRRMLYVSAFPIIIMTWITERFSVLQIEDGTLAALKASLGTIFVASITYLIMEVSALRIYLFAFPEILLVNIALLLLLGRYTGIRLIELNRFRELHKIHTSKKP